MNYLMKLWDIVLLRHCETFLMKVQIFTFLQYICCNFPESSWGLTIKLFGRNVGPKCLSFRGRSLDIISNRLDLCKFLSTKCFLDLFHGIQIISICLLCHLLHWYAWVIYNSVLLVLVHCRAIRTYMTLFHILCHYFLLWLGKSSFRIGFQKCG